MKRGALYGERKESPKTKLSAGLRKPEYKRNEKFHTVFTTKKFNNGGKTNHENRTLHLL